MKSIKKEFIVLGAIIILLIGYLLFQSKDKVHYEVPKLDKVNKENFDNPGKERFPMVASSPGISNGCGKSGPYRQHHCSIDFNRPGI